MSPQAEEDCSTEAHCCCDSPRRPSCTNLTDALAEQEMRLREEFEQTLDREINSLKDKFNYILEHEQARTSCMLREAHRERQEKVAALQQQLECKNLAALMYVMCNERAKCKMEKLQLIETYTNYINMLNEILSEGQELILHLSRGYKTAARVNAEWQEKMKSVIDVFLQFIYKFSGTPPEQNQYFFDLPKLLSTEVSVEDNLKEDPIDNTPPPTPSVSCSADFLPVAAETWWDKLEDEKCRPFVVYGDMEGFKPPQRRNVLKVVKADKTAPKKWKEYVFHDMFLKSNCPNHDLVKNEYLSRLPEPTDKWDCLMYDIRPVGLFHEPSAMGARRITTASVDIRGNMGSILKLITGTAMTEPVTKANLLGARDSMEIASTTKLQRKSKSIDKGSIPIKVGRSSLFQNINALLEEASSASSSRDEPCTCPPRIHSKGLCGRDDNASVDLEPKEPLKESPMPGQQPPKISDEQIPHFGKAGHTDSLEVIQHHHPDPDHKINYEKTCPMEKCQRMHVDTFIQSLPKYMRGNPFMQFAQTFDEYETCSPEQLDMLRQRLEDKKAKEKTRQSVMVEPLVDWADSVHGIATQTSDLNFDTLPPCTCKDPNPTPASSGYVGGAVYRMEDLLPAKQKVDEITRECLWDNEIDFSRFKVIGQISEDSIKARKQLERMKDDFTTKRLQEIKKILHKHPSLLEIFQANAKC